MFFISFNRFTLIKYLHPFFIKYNVEVVLKYYSNIRTFLSQLPRHVLYGNLHSLVTIDIFGMLSYTVYKKISYCLLVLVSLFLFLDAWMVSGSKIYYIKHYPYMLSSYEHAMGHIFNSKDIFLVVKKDCVI